MQTTLHQQLVYEKLDSLRPTQMTVGYRDKRFPKALRDARKLSGSQEARYLPGWTGTIAMP